jgi:DNA-directed RNA polymerase subunit beta'
MRTFHSGGVAGSDITQGLPRVEELFEARQPKKAAIMTEHSGIAHIQMGENVNVREVVVHSEETGELVKYPIPYGAKIAISDGEHITRGQPITEGSKSPADIMRICGLDAVYDYIIKEIQKVYRSQSCDVNDKHIEIIARQMTRRFRVEDNGDTDLLVDSIVDMTELEDENNKIKARIENGERELRLAEGAPVLLGITKAALQTESFLSAASFQETTKVLADAAIKCKVDRLVGLKENVIIGKLIPAGTGMQCYRDVGVVRTEEEAPVTEE